MSLVTEFAAYQDGSFRVMGRFVGLNNVPLTAADVAGIAWRIWETKAPAAVVGGGTLSPVSAHIFDELQSESWVDGEGNPVDAEGYNFRWDAPAGTLPRGDRSYDLVVELTLGGPGHRVMRKFRGWSERTAAGG